MAGHEPEVERVDAVVIGTGVAGLTAALTLAPRRVHILTKATLGAGASSVWAQGGVAAAVGEDDSPDLHAADTVAAGAGLVETRMARLLARDGVAAIGRIAALGAEFDRAPSGDLELGREAAHSRRRILHAHGDATGAELVRALAERVRRAASIAVLERTFAVKLLVDGERVVGVEARAADGRRVVHLASRVVLATGGCGQVWSRTTNPREATGDGLALAAEAGVELADLEFVQFHPTALALPGLDPMPLLTEALRGEGAILVGENGRRFMNQVHADAELAPRDVVARGIHAELAAGHAVFLDATRAVGDRFPNRFPTVFALCRAAGLDPRVDAIPVAPAAHYHMGGVAVDEWGRTSLAGLWACGEVASTGVHGANRLASNSLLEALVFGRRVGEDAAIAAAGSTRSPSAAAACGPLDPVTAAPEVRHEVRALAWSSVGLVRDGADLDAALARLAELQRSLPPGASEARSVLTVAWLVSAAAAERRESRGAHYRADFPAADPAWLVRLVGTPAVSDAALGIAFRAQELRAAPERTRAAS